MKNNNKKGKRSNTLKLSVIILTLIVTLFFTNNVILFASNNNVNNKEDSNYSSTYNNVNYKNLSCIESNNTSNCEESSLAETSNANSNEDSSCAEVSNSTNTSISVSSEEFNLLCKLVIHEVGGIEASESKYFSKLGNDGTFHSLEKSEFDELQRLMASVAINRIRYGISANSTLYDELTDPIQFMSREDYYYISEPDSNTLQNVQEELENPLFNDKIVFEFSTSAESLNNAISIMESTIGIEMNRSSIIWYMTADNRYLIFSAAN